MVLRELHVVHHNFCTGWLGGEVGDKIGKIGLYRVKKGLAWSLDFTLQAGESQRGVHQGPQKGTNYIERIGMGAVLRESIPQ